MPLRTLTNGLTGIWAISLPSLSRRNGCERFLFRPPEADDIGLAVLLTIIFVVGTNPLKWLLLNLAFLTSICCFDPVLMRLLCPIPWVLTFPPLSPIATLTWMLFVDALLTITPVLYCLRICNGEIQFCFVYEFVLGRWSWDGKSTLVKFYISCGCKSGIRDLNSLIDPLWRMLEIRVSCYESFLSCLATAESILYLCAFIRSSLRW